MPGLFLVAHNRVDVPFRVGENADGMDQVTALEDILVVQREELFLLILKFQVPEGRIVPTVQQDQVADTVFSDPIGELFPLAEV